METEDHSNIKYVEENVSDHIEAVLENPFTLKGKFDGQLIEKQKQVKDVIKSVHDVESRREILSNNIEGINTYLQNAQQQLKKVELERSLQQDMMNLKNDEVVTDIDHIERLNTNIEFLQDQLSFHESSKETVKKHFDVMILELDFFQNQLHKISILNTEIQEQISRANPESYSVQEYIVDQENIYKDNQMKLDELNSQIELFKTNILEQENHIYSVKQNLNSTEGQIKLMQENLQQNEDADDTIEKIIREKVLLKFELINQLEKQQTDYDFTLLKLSECKLIGNFFQEHLEELDIEKMSMNELSDRVQECEYFKKHNQQIINEVVMNKNQIELELEMQDLNRSNIHKNLLGNEEERSDLLKLLSVQESLVESHKYGYEHSRSHIESLTEKVQEYQLQINIESSKLKENQGNIQLFQNKYNESNLVYMDDVKKSNELENQVNLLEKELNDKEEQIKDNKDDLVKSSTQNKLIKDSFDNEKKCQIKLIQSCHEDEIQSKSSNEQLKIYDGKMLHINQDIDKNKQEEESLYQQQQETVNNNSKANSDINQSKLLITSFKQQCDELSIKQEIVQKNKKCVIQEINSTEACILTKNNQKELNKQRQLEISNVTNMLNETLKDYEIQEKEKQRKLKDFESIISKMNAEGQPVNKNLEEITEYLKGINQKIKENDEAQTLIYTKLNDKKMQNKIVEECILEEKRKIKNLEKELLKKDKEKQDLQNLITTQDIAYNSNIEKVKKKENERLQCEDRMKKIELDKFSAMQKLEQMKIQKIAAQERLQNIEKQKGTANVKFQELVEYKESIEKQCKENKDAYNVSEKISTDSEEEINIIAKDTENNKSKISLVENDNSDLNDAINQLTQTLQEYETEKDISANMLKETDIQCKILQTKLTENESAIIDFNQEMEQMNIDIKGLKKSIKDYESQKELIMQKSSELKEEENSYIRQIMDNDSLKSSLQIQIHELEVKKKDITHKHENTETDLNSFKTRMEEEKTKSKTLHEKFKESESNHSLIQDTLKTLVAKIELVEKNYIELESKHCNVNQDLESEDSNNKLMEETLNEFRFQQIDVQNKLSDLVNHKDSTYSDLNNHSTIMFEAKKSIENINTNIDSVGGQIKSVENELNNEQTVLLDLDIQRKTILDEIKEVHCEHNLLQKDINEKESNIDNLVSNIQNELSNKEEIEEQFEESVTQESTMRDDLGELEKVICNNKIIHRELEENITNLNEQIENNEIDHKFTNKNLVEIRNEIRKIEDQITLNNSEGNKWKNKLDESEKMRGSIYEYLTEIKSHLAKEKGKRTEIDNEISKSQCQQCEIKDKQTKEENMVNQGTYLKNTLEAKLNNVEMKECSNKKVIENMDEKKGELLNSIKDKESFQNENVQCLIKLETCRSNLQVDLEREETIKSKAMKLLSQFEISIDLLSKEYSEIENKVILVQPELSQLNIEKDSLCKTIKEHDIMNDSYRKLLIESESQREVIQEKLRKNELKQSLALHDLMDSETKRDLLNEQLKNAPSKKKKDQILQEIVDQEKRRINAQNEIKELVKTQDALKKQQTDEEKSHSEIQQQLKGIVENESLSNSHLQSIRIKIEEKQNIFNDLMVSKDNIKLKLFESKSLHELHTKNNVESDLNINSLLNKSKENKDQIKCLQSNIKDSDSAINLMKYDINKFEKDQDNLNKEIYQLGVQRTIIWKEIEEQTIKLAETQQNILEVFENVKLCRRQAEKWAEISVENNLILTELEEKIEIGQKQLKEHKLTRESIQNNVKELDSQKIIINDMMKNYKNNESIEEMKLNELKLQSKNYQDLLEEKISKINTVQQTLKHLEDNKTKNVKLNKENIEIKSNLFSKLNNSQFLENSNNVKIKEEKLNISELYRNLTDRESSIKSLDSQLVKNTKFKEVSIQKVNDLETLIKLLNIQVNEKQSEKLLIEQRLSETDEVISHHKKIISDLQNEIDLNNNMKNEIENKINGLNNDILEMKMNVDSMQTKCSDFNIQFSEVKENLVKLKEKENITKKNLEDIEEIRYSLLNDIKGTENIISGIETEYEKCQKRLRCIKEKMEENDNALFEINQEKLQCEVKIDSLINIQNEQKKCKIYLEIKQKELEELIISTQKINENKEILYSDSIKNGKEFQINKISIQDQIKCIIDKKSSLYNELEKTELQIDMVKMDMNKTIKKIDENKIKFDELSKIEVFLNEQLKKYNSNCNKESAHLIELQSHKIDLQSVIKDKESEIINIKQELVDLEEERYLIYEDLNKFESFEQQEQILLKDCINKYESLNFELEQYKSEGITLKEILNESEYQKKLTHDQLQDMEEKIHMVKEKPKDLSKNVNTKKEEKTMLESEILVISQDFIYLGTIKDALSADVSKNMKNENDLETRVKDSESQTMKYNNLIEDLNKSLNEINCKVNLVHGKINDQSDSFNINKENIEALELEIDLYEKKLKELGIQKMSMEQEIKKFEEGKKTLQVQIKEENEKMTHNNMQFKDYDAQRIFLQEKLKEVLNKNKSLCLEYQNIEKDKDLIKENLIKHNNKNKLVHEDLNNISTKTELLHKKIEEHTIAEKSKKYHLINIEAEREELENKLQTHEKQLILVLQKVNDLRSQKQDFSNKIKEQIFKQSIQQQNIIDYNTQIDILYEQLRNNNIKKSNVQKAHIASEKLRESYQKLILDNTNLMEKYKGELMTLDEKKEFLTNILTNLDKYQAQAKSEMKDSEFKIDKYCQEKYQEYIKNTETQDSIEDFKSFLNENIIKQSNNTILIQDQLDRIEKNITKIKVKNCENSEYLLLEKQNSLHSLKDRYLIIAELSRQDLLKTELNHELNDIENTFKLLLTKHNTNQTSKENLIEQMQEVKLQVDLFRDSIQLNEKDKVKVEREIEISMKKDKLTVKFKVNQQDANEMEKKLKDLEHFTKSIKEQIQKLVVCKNTIENRNIDIEKIVISITEQMENSEKQISTFHIQELTFKEQQDCLYEKLREKHYLLNKRFCKNKDPNTQIQSILEKLSDNISSQIDHMVANPVDNLDLKNKSLLPDPETILPECDSYDNVNKKESYKIKTKDEILEHKNSFPKDNCEMRKNSVKTEHSVFRDDCNDFQNIHAFTDLVDTFNLNNKSLSDSKTTLIESKDLEQSNEEESELHSTTDEILELKTHFPEDNYDKSQNSLLSELIDVSNHHNDQSHSDSNEKKQNIRQNIQNIEAEIKDGYEDLVEWQIKQALSQQLDENQKQEVEKGNQTQENLRKLEINKRMLYEKLNMDQSILRHRQDELHVKKGNLDAMDVSNKEKKNHKAIQLSETANVLFIIFIIIIVFFILIFNIYV